MGPFPAWGVKGRKFGTCYLAHREAPTIHDQRSGTQRTSKLGLTLCWRHLEILNTFEKEDRIFILHWA